MFTNPNIVFIVSKPSP